ncbi:Dual serine/threonine and tyrosine protein kinase [Apostichopus japonicus]|uniref:Dual serine/threonine and tyrosine protein kinase n=1 Tax=Stichopus japonicus TaxID=307972 RepID=A0A2G8L4S0_STIJA|nr:Dual serine/threonine and tyrosine protein kinase [Apostichopus japonicus]
MAQLWQQISQSQKNFHLEDSELSFVSNVVASQPRIVIFGQSFAAKATLANHLLGEDVLGVPPLGTQDDKAYRLIRIKYGQRRCSSLSLQESFELIDHNSMNLQDRDWQTIPEWQGSCARVPPLVCGLLFEVSPPDSIAAEEILDYSSSDSQSPEDCEDDSAYDTDEVGAKAGTPNLNSGRGSNGGDACRQSSLMLQLRNLGFLSDVNFESKSNQHLLSSRLESIHNGPRVVQSIHYILQWYLVQSASFLHRLHLKCMNMFIMSAFDMQRDILITPKRLEFAKKREAELFESLKGLAEERQVAISEMIRDTVESMENELVEEAVKCELRDIEESQEIEGISQSKAVKQCTQQIKDLVLTSLRAAVVERLVSTVDRLQDSYLGTLERCLQSLEAEGDKDSTSSTSHALQKILNSAYQIEVSVRSSSSVVKVFFERMKEILQSMKPFKAPPSLNEEWKRKVASTMIDNLDNQKLAKSLCSQFKSRLQNSHESFLSSLRQLEVKHSGRLEKTEEKRMKVRKHHAPVLARLALESTSFKDKVLHGMPKLEREIGRGQYGVVYSCKSWGGLMHCAVKSVVPPDDKHWNDLAMEFHYTSPQEDSGHCWFCRGPRLRRRGCSLAVLLIMERMQRDLHTGIKMGLDLPSRLQVALDVVEGIRYLHSLGLVHRDIKLKNVLPEAMMSGSIVGTPIHMAPELFTGRYDHTVDTYAFGILFWYIIAGHVKLPQNFEKCHNKDHLWSSVKQGTRPERLRLFDDECWNLMASCWAGEMSQRPLLGVVHEQLQEIRCRALERIRPKGSMPDIQTDPQLISSNIL